MYVPYLTEIFDPFLSLHSAEEHHSDHFSFGYLGGEKIIRKPNPRKKGSIFTCPIEALLRFIGTES